MSINVNNGYEQFYKGTEPIKNYGSGEKGRKDKVVKYEFNTTDEKGNKVMDKMSREETLQAMKDIRSQYGDDVIVEFSGDGMAALVENKYSGHGVNLDDIVKTTPEQQAIMDGMVVRHENTHRIAIPNVQTSDKLYSSLAGADEEVVKAANGIIKNYLMPGNVSGMSENERKSMIAFGMEEAKYLAENYLDEKQAGEFLSAMETIAKYGMNGSVAGDGTVTYHIEKGLNSAGRVDDMDILKEKAPDLYNEINELNQRIIDHKPGEKFGAKFLELQKRAEKVLEGTNGKGETNREVAVKEYKKWEEETAKTELPQIFKNTKYTNIQSFFESLQNQSQLSNDWLNNSMARFMQWLNR